MAKKTARKNNNAARKNNRLIDETSNRTVFSGQRYRDPIVSNSFNNIADPWHRWYLATESKFKAIWVNFVQKCFEGEFGFYDKADATGRPIHPEILDLLNELDAKAYLHEAALRMLIHGWQVTRPRILRKGDTVVGLDLSRCFSGHEIPVNYMIRANKGHVMSYDAYLENHPELQEKARPLKLNDIVQYRVSYVPRLPMFQHEGGMQHVLEYFGRNEAFHTTLGGWNYGMGYSELMGAFDCIYKILEQSDDNQLRQSIFFKAILNPDWSEEEAKEYIDGWIESYNKRKVFGYWPRLNQNGEIDDKAPDIRALNQGPDAPARTSGGSGGMMSDLNSEWAMLCMVMGYTIRYFTGNPGGAESAAWVDVDQDMRNDIRRFNLISVYLIKPFLKFLQRIKLIDESVDLNKVYIKSTWQIKFETEESIDIGIKAGQIQGQDSDGDNISDNAEESAKKAEEAANQQMGKGGRGPQEDWRGRTGPKEDQVSKAPTRPKDRENQAIDAEIVEHWVEVRENAVYSQGIMWYPVNSASGRITQAALQQATGNNPNRIFVKFVSGLTYMYDDQDAVLGRGLSWEYVFDQIIATGGEALWEYLRAPIALRAPYLNLREADPEGYAEGKYRHPKGQSKTGGGMYPWAGEAHYSQYDDLLQSIVSEIKSLKQNIAAVLPAPEVPEVSPIQALSPYRLGTVVTLNRAQIPSEFIQNDLDYWMDSETKAAREILHCNRANLHKELLEGHNLSRNGRTNTKIQSEDEDNWYIITNGFNKHNPFQYFVDGRIRVEYQCEDDIKRNVGVTVPMGIEHNLIADEVTLPEEQIVGTYTCQSYDEKAGEDVAVIVCNKRKVAEYFERTRQVDWITPRMIAGDPPEISTAYECRVVWNELHKVYVQKDIVLASVSFVQEANCTKPFCTSDLLRFNASIKNCVKQQIKNIAVEHADWKYWQIIGTAFKQCSQKM